MEKQIEVLVRAIFQRDGKFLVCQKIGRNYYFFPGGHVEFGEDAEQALSRELKEELGIKVKKFSFIGGVEHTFTEDKKFHHEINLAFWSPAKNITAESAEDHLRFSWISKGKMAESKIYPTALKRAVLKWMKDKKLFWSSQI